MQDNVSVFRSFLLIELDNLVEAIQQLIGACAEKYKKRTISHYVQLENTAFFQKEITGITGFREDLMHFNVDEFTDADDLAKALKNLFAERVSHYDLPLAIIALVDLKIDKVLRYIKQERGTPVH
jgi:hypothetical protein